ncbi:hypothetical protein A3C96_01310 [Candidatus Uhrbacteria bacterium RIFCSPHIGHO2_02_FULL_60_10]|uniref:Uncharacterized protein n=1 Tax=Candidatus Uhrbacteria bacterium RIFCSPHIGHO2_02_FULL_60_10 TaxID=1802392 RepID=A0A1F7U8I1_9BACT|nr:MAG: hypothetical protein A3C96_01310 [Candidatus Uhrbacteria bacterium RIFCSPHIGHO2_02_FULL_60_10]
MALPAKSTAPIFDEGVKLISYCPLCETSYAPEAAHVLGEKEDSHLLHIKCGRCSNAILALVFISQVGVSSVGLITDLDHHEVDRFKALPPVSTDDVIDTHSLLSNSDHLFSQLMC